MLQGKTLVTPEAIQVSMKHSNPYLQYDSNKHFCLNANLDYHTTCSGVSVDL